ncbi:MAG: hypothetical protein KIT70_05635 [Anaerolineales bacterium]|nr:MAG: hypothetical protein KIT70_05635 [Anaerolineales bacterium]
MKGKALDRNIARMALAAGLALAAMLAAMVLQGSADTSFDSFMPPAQYANNLMEHETAVRTYVALDSFFVIFYTALFVLLAMALKNADNVWLVAAGLGALLITTYLDVHENNELLVFIQAAKQGVLPSAEAVHARALWSAIKFHSSYISFFLMAFVLPDKTTLERALRWSLWVGYVLVGILVYAFPSPWFTLARFVFMLVGLCLLAWNFHLRSRK